MPAPPEVPFSSNAVRLTPRQWAIAAAILLLAFIFTPRVWESLERFEPGPDARMPYELSNDYWLFARHARRAAGENKTLVLGDSVIWGQYVTEDQTLPHCLNERAGEPRFANLGLDGAHPAALAGLLEHYGRSIAGKSVLLHCNLLWTASPRHDLQTEEEFNFNHPTLVPQFCPRIPCYTEGASRRLGILVEREVPFLAWASHLRLAYLERKDLPNWTLDHPYESPLAAVAAGLPAPANRPPHEPIPWTEAGMRPQAFPWVDLDTSFQWRSFQRAVDILQRRGNRLFVLVGPFNEHMIAPKSQAAYQANKQKAEAWLRERQIPHLIPPLLPSELYGDASHPLSGGYTLLAKWLFEDDRFAAFLRQGEEQGATQ